MKVRDSGMPPEKYWNSLFDVPLILERLKIDYSVGDAVEFGSGYGTFTIPASKTIKGNMYAVEIEPDLVELLKRKMDEFAIGNIKIIQKDFISEGTGLWDNSIDLAMLFNILHHEKPLEMLKEAYRVLRTGGRVTAIHWIYDADTPRGPSLDIRPKPELCVDWFREAGFEIVEEYIELPPYHYGIIGKKIDSD